MATWLEHVVRVFRGRAPSAPAPQRAAGSRIPGASRREPAVPGKYALLHQYLQNRYADVVVLTFGQIEDLVGSALPELARTTRPWWGAVVATAGVPDHSDAWTLAGRTANPNLLARNVVFERTAPPRHQSPE